MAYKSSNTIILSPFFFPSSVSVNFGMTSDRKNVQYSYLGLSADEICKQRELGYGDHDCSVGPSMTAAPSHHVLCSGLQVLDNGPSDILSGSLSRPSFIKPEGNEKEAAAAAAEDDCIAQDWLTALKPTRAFDSLIGTSATRSGSNIISSSASGLMNSQRIVGSPKYTEALHFCTEGLGFESSDETDSTASSPRIEPCKSERLNTDDQEHFSGYSPSEVIGNENNGHVFKNPISSRAPRAAVKSFPPPLPSIARNGQPCVMMKSYKRDGRFVLQEFKVPSHEVLHAWRCDGRLKLQMVQQQEEQKEDKLFKSITPNSDTNMESKIRGETVDNNQLEEESGRI